MPSPTPERLSPIQEIQESNAIATVLDQEQKTEDARKGYMTYVEACPDGKDIEAAKGAISRLE